MPPAVPEFGQRGSDTSSGEPVEVTWRGSPWSLTGLSFLNFFLSIITLGIYSFWGKTEVRKRIWSSVRINNEPLLYTGTGKELFLGFVIIFGVLLLPFILILLGLTFYLGENHWATITFQVLFYVIVFVLFGVAVYRARRYRLSRTNWRGIRGTLTGSPWRYAWTYIWTSILIIFTAGWILPYRTHALYQRMTNEQQFGSELFKYDGDVGDIYARFAGIFFGGLAIVGAAAWLVAWMVGLDFSMFSDPEKLAEIESNPAAATQFIWILAAVMFVYVFVLGLLQIVYFTSITNYITRHTTYSSARFDLNLGYGGMLWLFFTNILIVLGSLTILQPVAMARVSRYFVERLSVHGTVDVEGIVQNAAALGTTGEGLAEAFDIDGF